MKVRMAILGLVFFACGQSLRANTLDLLVTPSFDTAPPGGEIVLDLTIENTSPSLYVYVEDYRFQGPQNACLMPGCLSGTRLHDPQIVLAPNGSITEQLDYFWWTPNAPEGYSFTGVLSVGYLRGKSGQGGPSPGPEKWISTDYTVTVDPPVAAPEPGTLALAGVGVAFLARKLRTKTRPGCPAS